MAAKTNTKTKTKTKTTVAATISALSAVYSAQLPPLSHSFSHPKTHTRLDLRNERYISPYVCFDVHPSSCSISPCRSRCYEFTTALFQSQSSGTKVTNRNHVDEDDFSSTSPTFSSSSDDSSRESPSNNITSKQQNNDEITSSSITSQDDDDGEDDLDAIINENYSLLNEYDLEEEMVEEIANMTFITRNGTKITTPRRKATKAKSKANTNKTSSSSYSPLSAKTKSKSNMDTSTNAIDSFWSWALQSSSPKSTSPQTKQTNRRMQMFAYLSQPIVEVQIIGLVLLSCLLVAIDTLEGIPPALRYGINAVDTLCVYIFAIEFFLRWWSAGRFQLRYLAKPLVSIDAVVVILPLILSGLLPIWDMGVMMGIFPGISLPGWLLATSSANSALLNLRLLRILKFQRVLTDETTYMKFEMALGIKKNDVRPYQLQLARVLISIFTLVSVSTGLIYSAEHDVNPAIPDYFTALYFGLTTLTTVGFGDITPVTGAGRLVVGGSILAGVAVIPAQAASLAEAYLDFQKERSLAKNRTGGSARMSAKRGGLGGRVDDKNAISTTTICGKCGAGFHRMDASFCWSCGTPLKTMDTS